MAKLYQVILNLKQMRKEKKSNIYKCIPYFMVTAWMVIGAYDYYTTAIYSLMHGYVFLLYALILILPTQLIAYVLGGFVGDFIFSHNLWAGIGFFINFLFWLLIVKTYFYTIRRYK